MWASKVRSSQGCWTCRLRRKKCDENHPVCHACGSLEITCHFGDDKPPWMDGGPLQKEMADQLKRQVKVQANHRRERRYLQSYELAASAQDQDARESGSDGDGDGDGDGENVSATPTSNGSSHYGTGSSPSTMQETPPDSSVFRLDAVKSTVAEMADEFNAQAATTTTTTTKTATSNPGASAAGSHVMPDDWKIHAHGPTTSSPILEEESDMNFVMVYLDHVFPFLFPYYRPSLSEGGRGWLLSLLRSNKAVYHTALSLSSYFFSVVLGNTGEGEGPCQARGRHQLQQQQELALQEMRNNMTAINARGIEGRLPESVGVLNGIIQLLLFDVAVTNSTHWKMHLDAAISLLRQIVPEPRLWPEHMRLMGFPARTQLPEPDGFTIPWTTEQAALRTFGASLLLMDVFAATAAERRPLMQDYHRFALDLDQKRGAPGDRRPLIRFEDLFGVQTWIVHVIGEIAALDAWKKENRRAGALSVTQLVSRASVIERAIRDGIDCLDGQCPRGQSWEHGEINGCSNLPHPMHLDNSASQGAEIRACYGRMIDNDSRLNIPTHTKIYGCAALAYLSVVVSGWQPSSPEVACPIAAAVELFDQLSSPMLLRDLIWPFCVVGCLSEPSQRYKFQIWVSRLGPMGVFGSVRTATAVMETVWARGDSLDEKWDIASCLQILGRPVLLA